MKIIGAGMAGLLAANLLKHHSPIIYEAQSSLPNNHSAVLRFRTANVAKALGGISFKKVTVIKSVLPWKNPIADALAYSKKNLGHYRTSRSIVLPAEKEIVERYIAPTDLIQQMADRVRIKFDVKHDFSNQQQKVISTIPMPYLLDALQYDGERPEFHFVHGTNVHARIDGCDAYATLYVPHPKYAFSRISITGDDLIVEMPNIDISEIDAEQVANYAAKLLGIASFDLHDAKAFEQRYAKIAEIDDRLRKTMIFWASSTTGAAYQLGRFATWRPGLMLDDLVNDIQRIDSWIGSSNPGYDMDIHHAR